MHSHQHNLYFISFTVKTGQNHVHHANSDLSFISYFVKKLTNLTVLLIDNQ